MLRIGSFMGLPVALEKLGVCPETVLTGSGFDLSLFTDPDRQISFSARSELFAHCVERTGCQYLGLLVGQSFDLRFFGVLGLLMKYSADVGTAIDHLIRFQRVQSIDARISLLDDQRTALLCYEVLDGVARETAQVEDGVLAALCVVLRTLYSPEWKPVEVRLTHGKSADTEPYSQFFRCPISFSAEQGMLVFQSACLRAPLDRHDADLLKLLQKQLESDERHYVDDFVGQLRSLLRTAILSGNASAEQLAKQLSIHVRTMNRRLCGEGTSFQKLLDETRFELARRMLQNAHLTVCHVAESLGYGQSQAFTRAFRRWSGASPQQWRERTRAIEARGRRPNASPARFTGGELAEV